MIGHVRTALRMIAGFGLLIIGAFLSLPGVPGPGIAIIIVGLWLLSPHFEWARKSLAWAKERAERIKQKIAQKRQPREDGYPRASTD